MEKNLNRKLPLDSLLNRIDAHRRKVCESIVKDFDYKFNNFPGGLKKHQNWVGGYKDHVEETMNIAVVLYENLNEKRRLDFTLSQVLFCTFLHDFDKLLRFEKKGNKFIKKDSYHSGFVNTIADLLKDKYKYKLSSEEINAIKYTHGEGKDFHPTKRIMKPLATLVHCADAISARIWFNKGRNDKSW